jgi:serine/threonine-protein kinase RsbW
VTTDITVEVPARPEFVRILRAVAVGVAARLEFPYDTIDDLRMAVDEASSQLLGVSATATTLRMRLTPGDGRVAVVVAIDAESLDGSWPPPDAERSLAWQVLSGLADEAGFELDDGAPAVRLVKHAGIR